MRMRLVHICEPVFRRPLLCLVLLWCAGIALAAHLTLPVTYWLIACGVFLLCWLATHAVKGLLPPLVLGLAVLTLGAALYAWQSAPLLPGDARFLPRGEVTVDGYLREPPTTTASGWHGIVRLTQKQLGQDWERASGEIYVYGQGSVPALGRHYRMRANVQLAPPAGNPYEFSQRDYLAQRGLTYRVRAVNCQPLPGHAPVPLLASLRAQCSTRLRDTMPGAYAAAHARMLEGIVLGVYGAPLPEQLMTPFRHAGIIHIMVVSGSQVSLLGCLFIIPLAGLPLGRARTSYPVLRTVLLASSLPVLAIYIVLADRGPSVDRALLMLLITTLALFLALSPLAKIRSYRPDGLTLLSLAALILLAARPAQLFNPGFQLSFAAVAGLLTITPILMRLWPRLPGAVSLPLSATLGAQLMTYPVLAWHFGTIPVLAPLTNLIAVPIAGVLLPLGLFSLLSSAVFPPLAVLLNYLARPFLDILITVSTWATNCPGSELTCYTRSVWGVLLYLAFIGLGFHLLAKRLDSRQPGWDIPAGSAPRMW